MKIKYSLLDRLCDLTNKEVDFLIHIAHYQDETGFIRGIYYRDVCAACGMCKQTFYVVMRSLEAKGIIKVRKAEQDYDILILDNDFSYAGSYNEGYINVSRAVFDSEKFKRLRAKEKILMLHFMKMTHENAKSYQIRTENFYRKYTELLKVTKKALRGYLHSLKMFFSIGKKEGKYFITFLARVFKARRIESETNQYIGHRMRTSCRRNKYKNVESSVIDDMVELAKQYRPYAREQEYDIFDIISNCLERTRGRNLNIKYLHRLIRVSLGFEDAETLNMA